MTLFKKVDIKLDNIDEFEPDIVDMLKLSFEISFPNMQHNDNDINQKMINLKEYLMSNKAIVYGIRNSICLLGFVWFFPLKKNNNEVIHINHIVVKKDYRGWGIGKRLISFVEEYCKQAHIDEIELFVSKTNHEAVKFYSKSEFVIERFVMTKKLKDV